MNAPIYAPKWLIIYNLYIDCELMISNFYNQPPEVRNWEMLVWALRVLPQLPNLTDERNWSSTYELPSLSVYNDQSFLQQVSLCK